MFRHRNAPGRNAVHAWKQRPGWRWYGTSCACICLFLRFNGNTGAWPSMKQPISLLLVSMVFACGASVAAGPLAWHGKLGIAGGPGEKGAWRQNDSRYNYVDDPTVLIGQDGNVALAWVDQGRKDVMFQRLAADGGRRLTEAVNVSRSADTFSWLPRMARALDAPATIYVLWQEIIFSGGSHGGDMLFARSDDNGATFSTPVNLSGSIGGDGKGRINREVWDNGSYDLLAGPDGILYAAWTEYEGPLWLIRSSDGGKSFSRPSRIAGDHGPVRAPSLALNDRRALYMAWTKGDDPSADIHVAKSEDGGSSFGKPCIVATDNGYSDAPRLMVSPDGVLHLVYAQSRAGPFDRRHIHYSRSTDGCNFDPPRSISTPLPDAVESAAFPSLGIDNSGRIYVLFELFPNGQKRPRGLGMTVSLDKGDTFCAPLSVPHSKAPAGGTNGSQQGLLTKKLAVNGAGVVAVVNSSLRQDKESRVWLMFGRATAIVPAR